MDLSFNISYRTQNGEEILLNIVNPAASDGAQPKSYHMKTTDGEHWSCNVNIDGEHHPALLDYYYQVYAGDSVRRSEWTTLPHRIELSTLRGKHYIVYNHWTDIPEDSYRYSSAFTDCINHITPTMPRETDFDRTVRIVVRAPQLQAHQVLVITGAETELGEWDLDDAPALTEHNFNEWVIDLDANVFKNGRMEFKFGLRSLKHIGASLWETSMNRTIQLPDMSNGDVVVYDLDQAFFPIYNEKLAGTLVPVFSLRSKKSFGVGDFGDLKMMIDWVAETHQRVLQLLPVNDTTITGTWTDSYPYSCISIFALHPQYADLRQLPPLKDEKACKDFETEREALNALPQIDYEKVNDAKQRYLHLLYQQEGARMMRTKAYHKFFDETQTWLVPYAQYCFLRDKFGTADFSTWKGHETWHETDREALTNSRTKAYKDVAYYYFVQFILNTQMEEAHDYARSRGVILKGDIPIGVNRHGCDVWMEPRYFNLNGQAGAPPDDFSVNGQNWGFPTYNWDEMLKDGCRWWVRRFQNMSKFFDAYRIDHVLGFFRIWEIPIECVNGLLGQFSPSLAMSREEIESYGLKFQEEQFCKPFISDWVIDRVFKEHADEVRQKYLVHTHDDIYELKPEYNTQRKVEQAFKGKTSDVDIWLRDGLYALISDVLFVRDRKDANKFHPRISAQFDFTYEALYDSDKAAFNRLYNDYYYRRNNQFWYGEAMKKLPKLVQATRMLVCAEDLGMVPDCVAWVMKELRILSLEIQSMPKDPKVRFGHLSRNPYRSVCTISSHDMPTLRQWWDEDYERTQEYYNTMLYRSGAAPHPLPGWLARDIISRHLTSPSMLCIISLQDWMAIDEKLRLPDANAERINIPANPHHYWRYRMHLNLEDMLGNEDYKNNVNELVLQSGRR